MQLLLAELDKFSFHGLNSHGLPKHYPVILTGDLNEQRSSSVVKLIANGCVPYSDMHRSPTRLAIDIQLKMHYRHLLLD